MEHALLIICGLMATALILFAWLAWRIAPIVFVLMRAQVHQAQTVNELVDKVEELGLPKIESSELDALRRRVSRLETPSQPKARTRRKVTA